MRHTKPHPTFLFYKVVFFLFFSASIFVDCNPNDTNSNGNTNTTGNEPASTAQNSPRQEQARQNFISVKLDTLKLIDSNYNKLRTHFSPTPGPKSLLVVQFYFDTSVSKSPTLIAYSSKPGHQFKTAALPTAYSIVLDHGGPELQLPKIFVLGDQQIQFRRIDSLIGAAPHFMLYFIPFIQPGEINVRYKVCIDKGAGVSCLTPPPPTQPSPPANAN